MQSYTEDSFRALISRVYLNAGPAVDGENREQLKRRVLRGLSQTTSMVELICTQVDHIDADGITGLVELQCEAKRQHRRFRIVNPSIALKKCLSDGGFADALDFDDDSGRQIKEAQLTL